jgi:hypothetical protein
MTEKAGVRVISGLTAFLFLCSVLTACTITAGYSLFICQKTHINCSYFQPSHGVFFLTAFITALMKYLLIAEAMQEKTLVEKQYIAF